MYFTLSLGASSSCLCLVLLLFLLLGRVFACITHLVTGSRAIKSNPDLRPDTSIGQVFLHDFWGTDLRHSGSHKSYRPLCVLSFRLNYAIHQLSPWGYHLVNVILHSTVTLVFARISGAIFRGQVRPALIASVIFAVHPIHTDAVASVVGRADVASGLFFLLALHQYMTFCNRPHEDSTRPLSLSLIFAACAMLTKETGISKCLSTGQLLFFLFFFSFLFSSLTHPFFFFSCSGCMCIVPFTHSSPPATTDESLTTNCDARGTLQAH